MLSGVGPAEKLAALGIGIVADRPGVGRNLQDHPTVAVLGEDPSGTAFALTPRTLPRLAFDVVDYVLRRRGQLGTNLVETGGFVRTRPDVPNPDLQVTVMPMVRDMARFLPREHGYGIYLTILRPRSRGSIELASAAPEAKPRLHPHFLEDEADIAILRHGIRLTRQILAAPAFRRYAGRETAPGAEIVSDADLRDYMLKTVMTIFHPVGTCKMGTDDDPAAVLDARLRVRGIDGLRVADASVMPTIVSGNTNAPSIMIGERCAEFVLAG
jgi:choline dehydrogenase-like flavoprotein